MKWRRRQRRSLPVHPHVRGDDAVSPDEQNPSAGSPPRAWGRSITPLDAQFAGRFTPTCVGTIAQTPVRWVAISVHPHVRGDDAVLGIIREYSDGSPPRAWGRCGRKSFGRNFHRFTPTCVGTIASRSVLSSPPTVHPHVRGDDVLGRGLATGCSGSPPRAWGR